MKNNNKKFQKSTCKHNSNFSIWNWPYWLVMLPAQNFSGMEKYEVVSFCQTNTLVTGSDLTHAYFDGQTAHGKNSIRCKRCKRSKFLR